MVAAEVKVFRQLLLADVVRGVHSTGYCAVDHRTGDAVSRKKAVPSYDFLDMTRMTRDIDVTKYALLGHNRHATQGASGSDENAHPFEHGDIVLMHNGSLVSRRGLSGTGFAVDSEQIAYTVSQTDDVKEVISNIHGAFALVWYDKRDCCIRIVRNNERPLWFAVEELNGKNLTYYYASEKRMLEWILDRNNVTVKHMGEVKPGCLWTINPDMTIDHEDVDLYSPPKPSYQQNWYGNSYGQRSLPGNVGSSGFTGRTDEAMEKLRLGKGDDVYFEVEKSVCRTQGQPKRDIYCYEGVLLEDPDVVVKAYGQSDDYEYKFYEGTILGAYIDNQDDNRLVLSVGHIKPQADWSPKRGSDATMKCEFCSELIADTEDFHVLDDGVMHHECFKEYEKLTGEAA